MPLIFPGTKSDAWKMRVMGSFSAELKRELERQMAMVAKDAAQIMRQKAPREDGELIASIRSEGTKVSANAPHSLVVEFGSKKRTPKPPKRPPKPGAKKRKPKRRTIDRDAQPFFFISIREAADRASKRGRG